MRAISESEAVVAGRLYRIVDGVVMAQYRTRTGREAWRRAQLKAAMTVEAICRAWRDADRYKGATKDV